MSKTLFSEINEELKDDEGDSSFFYRKALRRVALKYKTDARTLISDEHQDKNEQDKNVLRTYPKSGHLMIFEYESKKTHSKYIDKCPICYMISADAKSFVAANLHYIEPPKRELIVNELKKGNLLFPKVCISKYNINQVQGLFLDIAFDEWDSASFIPFENFIRYEKGKEMSINSSEVWKHTNKNFKIMFKGKRIYKSYSKDDSDFKGEF